MKMGRVGEPKRLPPRFPFLYNKIQVDLRVWMKLDDTNRIIQVPVEDNLNLKPAKLATMFSTQLMVQVPKYTTFSREFHQLL